MIKKRVKKIMEISLLIAVRQIWKLLENIYHLLREPFLALKNLISLKDKSQIFLLSMVALMPVFGYVSARIIWDLHKYGFLVKSVGMVFAATMLIEGLILIYLGYWIKRVIGKKY